MTLQRAVLSSCLAALALGAGSVRADDTDIFLVNASNAAGKPNILFLVDNTSNWARQAQQWPDNGGTQGAAELAAIRNVVAANPNTNVGLAEYTTNGGGGGLVRFAVRDMAVSANRSAFTGLLNYINSGNTINSSSEKVNAGSYETASMYEVYKYFKGLPVFRGAKTNGTDPARNVDINGNLGDGGGATAFGQGGSSLTGNWAYTGSTYNSPLASGACGTTALIMIVNNTPGSFPEGDPSYEGVSAGSALIPIPGVSGVSWTDEWARFLNQNGITVYVLDAYNAQQNVSYSRTLERAGTVGGGGYYAVKTQQQIEFALGKIIAEINAKDTTFASAALPVSASNRSQYLNQVFIGMFRPDPDAKPRWLGNLKQYKMGLASTGDVQLRDVLDANAINTQTGFVHECAVSQWTTDSGSFWQDTKGLSVSASACTAFPTVQVGGASVTGTAWSDLPDGPTVAKGGVAETIRKGNSPPATNTTPADWSFTNRKMLAYDASSSTLLSAISTTLTGWTQALLNWVNGRDDDTTVDGLQPYSEYLSTSTTPRTRASVHGDVVHSRPLPVNYGGSTGVTVFYGANDGTLRAVDAGTGRERWSFIAPEHYAKFARLQANSPAMAFPGLVTSPTPAPKDYFFDGSIGLYQNADNSKVWIFPSQRRGGRMLYGFNVTTPDTPSLAWRVGCPNLADDAGCTGGLSGLGQTWSQPVVALVKGYPSLGAETPVVIVGGGYDACEDATSASPACSGRKGNAIFVIDAFTGALVRGFTGLAGSIAADLAVADRNGDGFVDLAYGATTTGDLYRVNFGTGSFGALASTAWGIRRIASSSGGGRKFLNAPALMLSGTTVYVALGSGDREKPLITQYPYTAPITNRFYVVMDDVADPTASPALVNLDDTAVMQDFSNPTSCNTGGVLPTSNTTRGWFMNLPGRGEQTVTSAVVVSGMVTFSTNRATSGSANMCSATANLGEARGYWLNILNASGAIGAGNATCGGNRSNLFAQGGIVPSPTLATVQIGNVIQTVALGAIQRSGGSSSSIAPQAIKPPIQAKRRTIYWRSNQAE